MASNDRCPVSTTYPPDIGCFCIPDQGIYSVDVFKENKCSVTESMVNFLNLTGLDIKNYLNVYCLHPPADDTCPFGYCPNPDIAGPLVRIANYVTGFCLVLLIFYSSEDKRVKHASWSQSLITYSLLITCAIAIFKRELTRYHAVILICMVCSPINVYFTGYSIRAFWSVREHDLDEVLGKKKYGRRAMVFFSVVAWIAILIYAYLPQEFTRFAQDACRGSSVAENFFLAAPLVAAWALAASGGRAGIFVLFLFLAVPILVVVAWVVAIIRRRKEIWPPGEPYRPRFGNVWKTIVKNYPFLQFWSVVVVPTAYWIAFVEIGILGSQDNAFSLTFGQILAVFIAVPPIVEVGHSAPDFLRWLSKLRWVRYVMRRQAHEVASPEETGTPGESTHMENTKKGPYDSQSNLVSKHPQSGIAHLSGYPYRATEHGQL